MWYISAAHETKRTTDIGEGEESNDEHGRRRSKPRKSEVTHYKMYIDGKFVDAKGGKTFDVYDPSTEGVIATCPAAGAEDVGSGGQGRTRAFYEDGAA